MKYFNNDEDNKTFLSKIAFILVIISIVGCILTIIDYHLDLHTNPNTGTQSAEFGLFVYFFNVIVIIGNLSYISLATHRYFKFTKNKN